MWFMQGKINICDVNFICYKFGIQVKFSCDIIFREINLLNFLTSRKNVYDILKFYYSFNTLITEISNKSYFFLKQRILDRRTRHFCIFAINDKGTPINDSRL